MTVRDVVRSRVWLAALAGGAVAAATASAQIPALPDPPIAGIAPAAPVIPPLPAAPAIPSLPAASVPPTPAATPVIPPLPALTPGCKDGSGCNLPTTAPVIPPLPSPPTKPMPAAVPAGPPAGAKLPPLVLPVSADVPPEPRKLEQAPAPRTAQAPNPSAVPAPVVTPTPIVPSNPVITPAPIVPSNPVATPTPVVPPNPTSAANPMPVVTPAPVLTEPPTAPLVVLPPAAPTAPAAPVAPAKTVIKEVAKPIPPQATQPAPTSRVVPPTDTPKVTGPTTTTTRTAGPIASPDSAESGLRPAKAVDHAASFATALTDAHSTFARVRDYSCHYLKQERVHGRLMPEQTAELHARAVPHSVALKVIAPAGAAGAESVFVDGKNAGKVRVKPAGAYGTEAWMSLDRADSRLTSEARHTAADTGIGPVIERLEKMVSTERRLRNPLAVLTSDYVFAGRPVTRFEVVADRPHALRYAHTVVVYIDKETKLPVRFEAYDQPATAGQPTGDLLECHSFVNVKLNSGVPSGVFEK